MSILVVGSVAFDTIETPFGKRDRVLGGSANYFSLSASFFERINLVGVVGEDFPKEHVAFLESRGIDTAGLKVVEGGRTFHWVGSYEGDMNEAITHSTCLNVFEGFSPEIPEEYRASEAVFLANIDPDLQRQVLGQIEKARIVACDTMNFWIEAKRDSLFELLGAVDIVIVNEGEARQLTGEFQLVKAARMIQGCGPKTVAIKKGEHGVSLFNDGNVFAAPAYPLERIIDPTGAGDTFAGGFMGHLARAGNSEWKTLKQAVVYGSVMASFDVEDFSFERLKTLTEEDICRRYRKFQELTRVE